MEKVVAKHMPTTASNNLRYERKFIYETITPEDLINTVVLSNSFCFREIFHRRTVNNIYYDDQAMSFYHQNVSGDELRDKYRLRWYGDAFELIEKPVLEIKKKYGAVGDKLSFALSEHTFHLKKHTSQEIQQRIREAIKENHTPELALKLGNLTPSLYNSYERRYFLSDCGNYRITIDYNMTFYNPHFPDYDRSKEPLSDTVLELKYNVSDDKESRKLTQQFTARLSKNSKYVRGVNLIHHQQNN
ncbi:VTC domain-containing protein [uncultured Dokdonia sp.]|uniref:VTC domain-containing protein n=1 Tax=uncultured Dokdonia sp. TaxID=575653 RepID=UPI002611CA66|nr:VTC domain-containing protein [uncultured Dokdonia sp.]